MYVSQNEVYLTSRHHTTQHVDFRPEDMHRINKFRDNPLSLFLRIQQLLGFNNYLEYIYLVDSLNLPR